MIHLDYKIVNIQTMLLRYILWIFMGPLHIQSIMEMWALENGKGWEGGGGKKERRDEEG